MQINNIISQLNSRKDNHLTRQKKKNKKHTKLQTMTVLSENIFIIDSEWSKDVGFHDRGEVAEARLPLCL